MTAEKNSDLIAEELGEEAVKALADGTAWVDQPDTTELSDAWPYRCDSDSCGQEWHKRYLVSGWEIHDRRLVHFIHECDVDGEWEVYDSMDVDAPGYEQWYADNLGHEAYTRAWLDYAAHVAKTGDDILGNYNVQRNHREAWTVKAIQDSDGVKFAGAHRKSIVGYCDRLAETDMGKLPEPVSNFLCFRDGLLGGFKSLAEFKRDGVITNLEIDGDTVTFDIEPVFPDAPELIRERIRLAAEEHINEESGETEGQDDA